MCIRDRREGDLQASHAAHAHAPTHRRTRTRSCEREGARGCLAVTREDASRAHATPNRAT
eukprot:4588106-Prymnesium_polylepis.1